jgi:hypothetical protein
MTVNWYTPEVNGYISLYFAGNPVVGDIITIKYKKINDYTNIITLPAPSGYTALSPSQGVVMNGLITEPSFSSNSSLRIMIIPQIPGTSIITLKAPSGYTFESCVIV